MVGSLQEPSATLLAQGARALALAVGALSAIAGCELSLEAAPCPCAEGFFCCETLDRCLPAGGECPARSVDEAVGGPGGRVPVQTAAGQANLVRDMAFDTEGNTLYWFDDGTWLKLPGTPANHWNREESLDGGTFATPVGLSPADIVGMATLASGEVLAWYDTGQLSRGDVADLSGGQHADQLERFVLPAGLAPAAILGVVRQNERFCAFFEDETLACGSATDFRARGPAPSAPAPSDSAASTGRFAVRPETSASRIDGLAATADAVWAVYDDGAFSSGSVEQLDAERFRPGAVAGMAMSESSTWIWYRSGLLTRSEGRPEPMAMHADEIRRLHLSREQRFAMVAVARSPEDAAGQGRFFAWFRDGTALEANGADLVGGASLPEVALPAGASWDEVMAMAIARDGEVATWFSSGELAVGTPSHLDADQRLEFEVPKGYSLDALHAAAIAKDTNRVHSLLADGSLADGSALRLDANSLQSACDPQLDECQATTCGDTDREDCPLGCHPLRPRCYMPLPSGKLDAFLAGAQAGAGPELVLSEGATIDTDSGVVMGGDGSAIEVPFAKRQAPANGVPTTVFSVQSADLHSLQVQGQNALVLVAAGNILLRGELTVAAEGERPGPGALPNTASCTGSEGGMAFDALGPPHGGGGGGGSHGFGGHVGGDAGEVARGGHGGQMPPGRSSFLEPLRGGCSGGAVSGFVSAGGGGGGAVHLVSGTAIELLSGSAINASGGGGSGGGGGGSGGGILLEAPQIHTTPGVALVVGGGGGGGGCRHAAGSDGLLAETRAPGGDCSDDPHAGSGGAGGVGAVSGKQSVAGESASLPSGDSARGGGGGGGAGRVVLRNASGELNLHELTATLGVVRRLERR